MQTGNLEGLLDFDSKEISSRNSIRDFFFCVYMIQNNEKF